jgi:hypothetical protein
MMSLAYEAVRISHLVAGAIALILFWVPALTRKGGVVHRRAGRWYVRAMGVVVVTAIPLSIRFLVGGDWFVGVFLGYLAVITFSALWGGRQVLNYKRDAAAFRTPMHAAVGVLNLVAAITVLVLAWTVAPAGFARILFTIFSIIGFSAAFETWQFFRRPPDQPRWWWFQHFGGMIGSGIAAHTAFGAFGVRRLLPEWQLGALGLLPWIAPSIVGTIAIVLLTRHHRKTLVGTAGTAGTAGTTGTANAHGGEF